MVTSTFMGFSSYTLGFNQKLSAHFKFARSLENPAGFNRALRNVNARLGGPEHFPYGVPEHREEHMGFLLGPGVVALPRDPSHSGSSRDTTEPGEGWAVSSSPEELDQSQGTSWFHASFPGCRRLRTQQIPISVTVALTSSTSLPEYIRSHLICRLPARQTHQPSVQRPPSRWDQIRAANNRGGTLSSWDLIRQNHERNRLLPPSPSQPSTDSRNPVAAGGDRTHGSYDSPDSDSSTAINEHERKWDKRAIDEAQFEAVLEAERRRASQA